MPRPLGSGEALVMRVVAPSSPDKGLQSLEIAGAQVEYSVIDLYRQSVPPFLDNDAAGTGQVLEIGRYLADFTLG